MAGKRSTPKNLGPSDGSDSGSDIANTNANTDLQPSPGRGADISADRIVGPEEAGLGGGLDQAEEAEVNPENSRRKKDDR